MNFQGTQGSVKMAFVAGSAIVASMLYLNGDTSIVPIPEKNYHIVQPDIGFDYQKIDNLLKLEQVENKDETEPIIKLKTIKKISIKINKPTPLKYVSVQDSEGFIG